MNIRKNEPKDTTLSTIGHVYEGVGGKALEAFLLAVCPQLAPAALITGLFSHAKTMRGQLKLDHFLSKVAKALEEHRNEIDYISENIEEVLELARQGITTSATIRISIKANIKELVTNERMKVSWGIAVIIGSNRKAIKKSLVQSRDTRVKKSQPVRAKSFFHLRKNSSCIKMQESTAKRPSQASCSQFISILSMFIILLSVLQS